MNRNKIEEELKSWFKAMIQKYNWLNIRYEYCQIRHVWLVSFSPANRIDLSEEFNADAMDFADKLNEKYGDGAPLFTDEEYLFKLSSYAVEVSNAPTFNTMANLSLASWVLDILYSQIGCNNTDKDEYQQIDNKNHYLTAA